MPNKNYYQILEVEPTASESEIKKAYFRLALRWHPDKNNSSAAESRFKEISAAYQALTNSQESKEDAQTMFAREYGAWIILGTGDGSIRNSSGIELSPGDVGYNQIRREIIDNIKENRQEWLVQEINTRRYPTISYPLLVHHSFRSAYDDCDSLIVDYGKVHWKRGFTEEEWKEIEQVINPYQTYQSEREGILSGKWGIIGVAICFFLSVFLLFFALWKKLSKRSLPKNKSKSRR